VRESSANVAEINCFMYIQFVFRFDVVAFVAVKYRLLLKASTPI
jgi:hypothetical protein